jgi:hypothetical protein
MLSMDIGYPLDMDASVSKPKNADPYPIQSYPNRFSDYPIGALILGQEMGHGAFN